VQAYIENERKEKKLPYNHFISVKGHIQMEDVKLESIDYLTLDSKNKELELKPKILCGYDGFSGVHDNLKWILGDG